MGHSMKVLVPTFQIGNSSYPLYRRIQCVRMLHVTLPPRADGDKSNNHTECYISAAVRDMILNTPGFPQEPAQPSSTAHRIGSSPDEYGKDAGLAVYATRDIKQSELIFSERPLFVLGDVAMIATVPIDELIARGEPMASEQFLQVRYKECEAEIAAAVEKMTEANRTAYMALANNHEHDGNGPTTGILRTNGFNASFNDPDIEGEHGMHSGVCNHGSRLNHRYLNLFMTTPIQVRHLSPSIAAVRTSQDISSLDHFHVASSRCVTFPRAKG